MDNVERTFIMLKPDCIQRGLVGEVISRIERKGYRIANAKMTRLSKAILDEHYAHMVSRPYYPQIVEFMTSGPVLALIVEGVNAVAGTRTLIGATEFEDHRAGTIRGDLAYCVRYNLIHGSDSAENAEIEIKRFFG
jgi:nucleoside-diphosphate kinase